MQQAIFYALAVPLILGAILIFITIVGTNIRRRATLKAKKLVLPALLIFGTLFLVLFEKSQILPQVFILFLCFLIYFFFTFYKNIPIEEGDKDQVRIKNYFNFAILFAAFLSFLVAYNLLYIFQFSLGLVVLFIIVLGMLLFYYQVWIQEGKLLLKRWLFVALLGLVVSEIFLILAFWPASPWVLSGIMLVIFYMFFGIFNLYLEKKLRLKFILEYLIVGGVFLVAIVTIMRWYF